MDCRPQTDCEDNVPLVLKGQFFLGSYLEITALQASGPNYGSDGSTLICSKSPCTHRTLRNYNRLSKTIKKKTLIFILSH